MKKGLFFLLLAASLLTGGVLMIPSSQSSLRAASASAREIEAIDQEIAELVEKRKYYKAKVLRLEINANRWQFDNSTYQDARRAWKEIDDTNQKIAEIDLRIAELQLEKEAFLK